MNFRLQPTEADMQKAVAKLVGLGRQPGWFCSHIGHGLRLDRAEAGKARAYGVMPGLPDWIVVGPQGFHFLELKRRPNGLTREQRIFRDVALSAGGTFAVAYEVEEAIEILTGWGAVRVSL